jgi:hypothetical protein
MKYQSLKQDDHHAEYIIINQNAIYRKSNQRYKFNDSKI